MKTRKLQVGLTLVDMLVAVAIIAILAGMVLTTLNRIDSKAKEQLCEATLETLNTALRQFRDYGFQYRVPAAAGATEIEFYRSLKFPPDCSDFLKDQVELEVQALLNLSVQPTIAATTAGQYDPNDSGSAVMYFFLTQVPECRETLAGIDPDMLKSDHKNDGNYWTMTIMIDLTTQRSYPWIRVVDPWGKPLKYDYYINKWENTTLTWTQRTDAVRSFPLITSAGPDKQFDTNDDITNRVKTETPVIP